jgi:alkyl sulfatase BDS1-like metallo-beta-lactamase superfamily hydrolase
MFVLYQCSSFTNTEILTRYPKADSESQLTYVPPPKPNTPLVKILKTLPQLILLTTPKVMEISDNVYIATGFGLSNVVMINTYDGLVIIDTGDSEESARQILKEFREITETPIKYIILTHSHPDHINGLSVFLEPGIEIIATTQFNDYHHYQNKLLSEYTRLSRLDQAGMAEQEYGFPLPIEPYKGIGTSPALVDPTITFEDKYTFEIGDRQFELFHTQGETPDHLAVWMPEERILFPGDLYYHSFPNLSSPMLETRSVQDWIESLARLIELNPETLVPQHTMPVFGNDKIRTNLTNYRNAIKFVHDETVRYINEGRSEQEAVDEIHLPEDLIDLPYLQELYGQVDWSIRGIYRNYTGWYNGNGTTLNPLPEDYLSNELIHLSGGVDKVLGRAIELQKRGEHQLCAELCDIVIKANPDEALAHRIKAESMYHLAYSSKSLNGIGFYRSAYSKHLKIARELTKGTKIE